MSASLLLPCASPPYNSSNIAPSLNRGGSNGLLSSCSSCQGTGKTPLLKARRLSPQPLVVPGTHNNQNSPNQELDILNSSGTSVCQDYLGYSQNILPSESHQVNKRGSGDYCMVDGFPPVEILSSQESKFNLRTPTSSDIPFFGCRQIESVSPDNQVPSVHQSKPALIMPSLFSFLKSDPTPKTQLPRNPSSRSLNNPSSPSPLIRKCNTMVALSDSGNSSAQSTTTKLVKERKSRLSFLRCVSSSPSNSTSGLKQSPSTSQVMQWRKRSSGVWPREPLEGKDGADVPEPITPPKGILKSPSASFGVTPPKGFFASQTLYCKLCLSDVSYSDARELEDCQCKFCTYCLRLYSSLKIRDGEFRIECPDAKCKRRGALNLKELHSLVGSELMELHDKYRRLRDVEMDPYSTWCPKAGCETVVPLSISKFDGRPHCSVCATCKTVFCASCSEDWHPGKKCTGPGGSLGVPLNDTIKRCPSCKVPIERDAGCAQMQCKKCKHVFCWYCLASLEDDFLLRHYDKGPCKNKLGHSRASVLWHRAQVVVIFAGFGLLLVFASPLLLLVGPCLLCRGCRQCPSDDSSSSSGRSDSSFSGDSDYD